MWSNSKIQTYFVVLTVVRETEMHGEFSLYLLKDVLFVCLHEVNKVLI